jgi:glycosyltransferase involved in cell wall biosynthesis
VIPNGIDFALFRPLPRAEARARAGLALDRHYAVFPADPAIPRKAFAVAVAAVRDLALAGTPIELLAVHGQPQTVVVDYFNAADVVILPSMSEGSPNVVKEAMACGIPVVATDVGDVREVIGRTKGCAVVDRTADAFAAAIEAALKVSPDRTTGRDDVAHLSLRSAALKVRDLYGAVLARHHAQTGSEHAGLT